MEFGEACEDKGCDLTLIKRGVYVIALSNPLSIQYRERRSQVIYIGMGSILNRIKIHFETKLFDFMLDLAGADFDFLRRETGSARCAKLLQTRRAPDA